MLFYDFKNYEGFKELFGIVEHGNGVKSRKNKILLSLYKDRSFLKNHIRHLELDGLQRQRERLTERWNKKEPHIPAGMAALYRHLRDRINSFDCDPDLLMDDMVELKNTLFYIMGDRRYFNGDHIYSLCLRGKLFYSPLYETDSFKGLCEDRTLNAIRYVNKESGRVFKMKAGKMFNHLLDCNRITQSLPEQVKRWMSEEFVADWIEYARKNLGDTEYTLHVDDNFEDIYTSSRCAGYDTDSNSFGSCMVGDDQWRFYRDSAKAKAAYLTDADGMIVARCIVFTDVTDEDGNKWRLAERQYSKFCDPALQRQLVNALIEGGHIDGYKQVGSSCGAARSFVDNDGNSLQCKEFSTYFELEDGDTLSYQDSFKWYNPDTGIATNYGKGDCELDITDSEFSYNNHEYDRWSRYHEEWIPEDDAYYVENRDDYFYRDDVCCDPRDGEWYFEDDCIEINGRYYYAGEDAEYPGDYGIYYCDRCDEYYLEEDECYSEITGESYCSEYCMEQAEKEYKEKNWHYASYDEEYYEDEDDVLTVLVWDRWTDRYDEETMFIGTFNDMVRNGEATECDGDFYIDDINFEGEPAHYSTMFAVTV